MTNDVHSGVVSSPSLLRLLALAQRIFGDCTAWLLLLDSAGGRALLMGESGPLDEVDFGEVPPPGRIDVPAIERVFPSLREKAERIGVSPLAAVAVCDGAGVTGLLFLASAGEREFPESDWLLLEDLGEQVAVLLERDRLAGDLAGSQVSEREARKILAEIQGEYDLVMAHVLEVICKIDSRGVIHFINPSAEEACGFAAGSLIGRNCFEMIHPDDQKQVRAALRNARQDGQFEVEVRCRCQEAGRYIPFLFFGAVLQSKTLQHDGFFVAGRNISRRIKAESELRRLETRFQLVWENSRDPMRLTDRNGIVVQVNDAYCRLVDKPRSEVLGKPFVVAYEYDEPEGGMAQFGGRMASRTMPVQLELELPLWNGSQRVFELSNSLFEVEEETVLLTIYHDVTERRKREGELNRLNDALQQRANHLGALALQLTRVEQEERRRLAQVLHDNLQQLLVAARMSMERVRKRLPGGTESAGFADLEFLLDESISASRSITVELSPPILHDGGLMAALEWLGRSMREKHGLTVYVSGSQDADCSSEVLRVFLFQAVRELLFNCKKHAGVGEASVLVERVDEGKLQVVVEDDGAGFDAEEMQPGGKGAAGGFGLFSVRERIEHIGGFMHLDTAPGKGARVTLVAPLDPSGTDVDDAASVEEPILVLESDEPGEEELSGRTQAFGPNRKVRLVLVDDHKIMRQGLCQLLREQPDMVVIGEAENGLEGLRLAQELQPDVVVMDISMPVMNGIEATRIISAELPQIKVIGLSMHVKEDMATAMLAAGVCAYVTKATAAETLTGTIRRVMGLSSKGHAADAISVSRDRSLLPGD